MTELIFKELSYQITGLVFEVFNLIGAGQSEKIYGDALAEMLSKEGIEFQRELYYPIKINDKVIKKQYFDFIVDDKIIIELKVNDKFYKQVCSQLFKYLKSSNHKLGIIYRFTNEGVRVKRIPNYY